MSPALRHPNGPAFDTNALQVFSVLPHNLWVILAE
jgi:hypothetical protein